MLWTISKHALSDRSNLYGISNDAIRFGEIIPSMGIRTNTSMSHSDHCLVVFHNEFTYGWLVLMTTNNNNHKPSINCNSIDIT